MSHEVPNEAEGTEPGRGGLAKPRLGSDASREVSDLVIEAAAFCHELFDLALGVHDGRVVAATERLTDLGQ